MPLHEPTKYAIEDPTWDQNFPEKYRCTAKSRMTGNRCRKRCVNGSDRCKTHLRNRRLGEAYKQVFARMAPFYKKHLSATLAQALEQAVAAPIHEQTSMYEELHLMRGVAGRAVELWSRAHDVQDEAKRGPMLDMAGQIMSDALERVGRMAEQAARISSMGKDKFSVHNLQAVVYQITVIAQAVLKDHPELAKEFETRIRTQIVLPTEAKDGTSSLPGEDEEDMDDTVPLTPDEDE